jgi:hypothetical protein
MRRTLLFMLVALLSGCGAKAPQTDLVIPINVRCSTCTDYIRCDNAAANPAVHDPAFSLYELQAKGPGNDITTIPEYFLQFVEPKTSYTRPLAVHAQMVEVSGQLDRHTSTEQTATIDVVRHRISLPDAWIDQLNGEWHGTDDSPKGICRILGRQEGGQIAELFVEKAQ